MEIEKSVYVDIDVKELYDSMDSSEKKEMADLLSIEYFNVLSDEARSLFLDLKVAISSGKGALYLSKIALQLNKLDESGRLLKQLMNLYKDQI